MIAPACSFHILVLTYWQHLSLKLFTAKSTLLGFLNYIKCRIQPISRILRVSSCPPHSFLCNSTKPARWIQSHHFCASLLAARIVRGLLHPYIFSRYMEPDILERILDGREKPTNLPFALLKNITENFSEDRVIGQGGFATVYKGILPKGCVAVKRIRNNHSIDERLFHREVDSLLTVNHQNVVRFLGFCASTEQTAIKIEGSSQHIYAEIRERLLCFEYISNGSLQEYLTDELRGLDWNIRYQIIKGICEGLHHLHKEKHIYHMDLKPANILLDNHMVPKITDFGLSRLDEKSQTMSEGRCGTLGYCSPEYLLSGKMSFKSDMFSLGIIMAELVTGNKGIPDKNKNNVLRRWRHRLKKSGKGTPLVYQQVAKCIEFGSLWQDIDLSKRPFIWDIIHDIREIEGVDGKINNAYEYTFGQITSEGEMLGIEPLELRFPFELNKQLSCSLKLTNETDSHTAFYIQNMSPLPYCIQPQKGIVPPRSECRIDITLEPQDKAPKDMLRADEFLVSSTKVNGYLAADDITTSMFNKEKGVIDEVSLDVLFDAHKKIEVLDGSHCLPLELYVSLDTNKLDKIQVVKSLHQEVPLPTSSSKNRKRISKVEAFHRPPMDTDCVASTLKVVTDGIRECYAGRTSNLSLEELYRSSYNLVVHKHGEELYSAVEAAMASEVKDLGRALDGVPDGMQFLQELLAKWDHHRKAVSFNKNVMMYMDRTFVITKRKTPFYELGLHLWRDCVIRSDKVRPRLINVVRRERGSEYATSPSTSVIGGLIAGVSKMLKELGDDVYLEVMEASVEALHHKAMDVVDQLDKKAMDAPPL